MSTTQTKKLSEATVVQSITEADKIPIVNSSGQTVLVTLDGLLKNARTGVNLLKGSAVIRIEGTNAKSLLITRHLSPGDKLTLSVDDVEFDDTSVEHPLLYASLGSNTGWIHDTVVNLQKKYCTFTVPQKNFDVNSLRIIITNARTPSANLRDNLTIYGLSLVRGTSAPLRWAPAPEDLWGGVNPLLSEVYTPIIQPSKVKGGWRHERAYKKQGIDKRGAERRVA